MAQRDFPNPDTVSSLPLLFWSTDTQLRIEQFSDAGFNGTPAWKSPEKGAYIFEWIDHVGSVSEVISAHKIALQGGRTPLRATINNEDFFGWVQPREKKRGRIIGCQAVCMPSALHTDTSSDSEATNYAPNTAPLVPWQEIVEAAVDFVLLLDQQGKILDVNRAAKGVAKPKVLGRTLSDLLPEASRATLMEVLQRVLETGVTEIVEIDVPGRAGKTIWLSARMARLRRHGDQAAIIMAATDITKRKQTEQKLTAEEALLRQLLDVQDRERRLIAYDIHDGFVQDVVAAQMMVQAARGAISSDPDRSNEQLERASELLGKSLNEGRRLISELRPMIIDEMGIVEAMHYLISEEESRGNVSINFTHRVRFNRLEPLLEGTMFRIVQEALTNTRRHAIASNVRIRMTQVDDGHLVLEIHDDGVGFDLETIPEDRFGLEGMQERARAFGGGMTLESNPQGGTRITVKLPLQLPTNPPTQQDDWNWPGRDDADDNGHDHESDRIASGEGNEIAERD